MKIFLILGIYYEEEYYRCETIEGACKTLEGATKKLVELADMRPYDEYEIRPFYVGE